MDLADETEEFYMVARAQSQAGFPVCFLTHPPRAVQDQKSAESEAVRLSKKTGELFVVLKAVANVKVVDGVPRWNELNTQ